MIRGFAWAAAGILFLAGQTRSEPTAPHTLRTAMNNEPSSTDLPPLGNVTLAVDNQPLVITPTDAEQIANALQRYLVAHESTAEGVALPRVAGLPWVDSRGTLRVGTWMLESRGDHLVLTLRDPPRPGATFGYQFIGSLMHTTNDWQVPSVGLSRIKYR